MKTRILALTLVVGASVSSQAATYSYVDWDTQLSGSVTGVMTVGSQTVNATYTGNYSFAQTDESGTYYYSGPNFTSSEVDNAPASTDIIAISGGQETHTISFDKALINPIFDIVSLGNGGTSVTYTFDKSFSILSQGGGYWGGGSLTTSDGLTVEGIEGHGTLQFMGSITSLTWTTGNAEYWHGFTVGAAEAVPEPASMAVIGLGLAAIARRRKA